MFKTTQFQEKKLPLKKTLSANESRCGNKKTYFRFIFIFLILVLRVTRFPIYVDILYLEILVNTTRSIESTIHV